jgi:MFS-type transporter involved in bile tolerance (Atg22 family)
VVAVLAVCACFGATAIGWNGVQLAQVARLAPAGQAGAVTGAAGFITFAGVVVGPPTFALLAGVTGSYRVGFVAFASLALIGGLRLLYTHRK